MTGKGELGKAVERLHGLNTTRHSVDNPAIRKSMLEVSQKIEIFTSQMIVEIGNKALHTLHEMNKLAEDLRKNVDTFEGKDITRIVDAINAMEVNYRNQLKKL